MEFIPRWIFGRSGKPVTSQSVDSATPFDEALNINVLNASGLKTYVRINSGDADVTYVGVAQAGTATSAAKWQIQKIDNSPTAVTGEIDVLFADGNTNFDNIFDNRESLSYS